jgi:hypothetical protein
MYDPLLWEYGTKSSTDAAQLFWLLSKSPAELRSGLNLFWCLPQLSAEVLGAPKFDLAICQMFEHLRMLL